MSFSTGSRLGPYQIGPLIGAGGMGEVYRARDIKLDRDVALKVLASALAGDTEYLSRFQREAHVLASLNHPHIASIHGLEESGTVTALVMELVEGPTLADRIKKGPLPLAEALDIAKQMAEALEYAHDKSIIHRDLKPANVKLTPEGSVKLLDFGLARAAERHPDLGKVEDADTLPLSISHPGRIVGTPAYMSPEQARGEPVDKRTDIWAFGVVLLEMLTGKRTFGGKSTHETLAAVLSESPNWDDLPSATPASIRRLLTCCLKRDPKRRLRDIGDARIAIDESAADPAPISLLTRRSPLPWALAVVSAIAALTVSLLYFREIPSGGPQVKYLMGAPEGAERLLHIIPSHDGRLLAFTAETGSGGRGLWVRRVDSVTAQLLAGTDDALLPFWSPDNRYVGFWAGGEIKRIDVGSLSAPGPPQKLCEARGPGGATWNRNGVILFGAAHGTALYTVSAAGGECKALTTLDPLRQERTHFWPWFLPDGRHFLFTVVSDKPENSGVFVGALNSPERKRLLKDLSSGVFVTSPDVGGLLLFVRSGALMAQPFDADKLRLTSEPVIVAEHIRYDPSWALGSFAVSESGVLAILSASIQTQLTWFDRGGNRIGTVGEPGVLGSFDLSPDERQVAVSRLDPVTGTSDIWRIEMSRGVSSRVTFDPKDDVYPLWSPDGKRIVFSSDRRGSFDLYEKDINGWGKEELLASSGRTMWAEAWSPSGGFLLYSEEWLEPKWRPRFGLLATIGDRKPLPIQLSEFSEWQGAFSPDGRWLAYDSDESDNWEVFVRRFDEVEGRTSASPGDRARARWQISNGGGVRPRWRRDGRELFYRSYPRKVMSVVIGSGKLLQPGVPQLLFETSFTDYVQRGPNTFATTSDGQRFLIPSPVEKWPQATIVINWTKGLKP